MDARNAAHAYADAGWYVGPVRPGTKNPGSRLGAGWQKKSTRDHDEIDRWWGQHPDDGVFLHVGRSGGIVFDLDQDNLDALPSAMAGALRTGQAQLTRQTGDRGHYLFRCERGEAFSNGAGNFAGFGDVRGANGVIIAQPSVHPDARTKGGQYHWTTTGAVPPLPDVLRRVLTESSVRAEQSLTSAELDAFLDDHTSNARPSALKGIVRALRERCAAGEARHPTSIEVLTWAFREARLGYFPAREAYDALEAVFCAAFSDARGLPGARSAPAPGEWRNMALWAAAEASVPSLEELHDRADDRRKMLDDEQLREEVDRERRRQEARAVVRAERAAHDWQPWPAVDDILAEIAKGITPVQYVVGELAPVGARVLCVAEQKAGKTTLGFNLMLSLMLEEDFLGRFPVGNLPAGSSITYLNFELEENQAKVWMADLLGSRGLLDDPSAVKHKLYIDPVSGHTMPLPARHVEDYVVEKCRQRNSSVLVIDPYGAAIEHEENDNDAARAWTQAMDRIVKRAGLSLLIVVAHSGSSSVGKESLRMRGAYRIEDWRTVKWEYRHSGDEGEDPTGTERFLKAFGRDVNVPQMTLDYDTATRTLYLASGVGAGGRSDVVARKKALEVFQKVKEATDVATAAGKERPGWSLNGLYAMFGTDKDKRPAQQIRAGVDYAVQNGWLDREEKGRSYHHSLGVQERLWPSDV